MQSSPKIAVQVDSEQEMDEIAFKAQQAGLSTFQVQDAGRTEVEPGSKTVLCIGPGLNSKINPITAHLSLLK